MRLAFKVFIIGTPLVIFVAGLFFYLTMPDVTVLKTKNPRATALMLQRFRTAKNAKKEFRLRQEWIDFQAIPAILKDTIRISEDAGFYQHGGIDFTELIEAVKKNWKKGKYARGASTITQQLAKNLYLTTEKSLIRKIKEYYIARRLEAYLSKDRIFHLYLNVIEWGPGIFGIEAASQYYFHKTVNQLNLEEIVRLVAVIPRPLKINCTENSDWLKWKARWILDTLKRYGYIGQMEYQTVYARFQ